MTTFKSILPILSTLAVVSCNIPNTVNTQTRVDFIHLPGDVQSIYRAYANRDDVVEDIMLRLYNGRTTNEYVEIKLLSSEELLPRKDFHMDKMTVFYFDGYKHIATGQSVLTIVTAYLDAKPDDNIILVDWSNMAMGDYFFNAAPNTRKVAYSVAQEIKKLIDRGLSLDRIHLLGHSLGGQIVGFVGKEMKNLGQKLKRISSLDPSFPMFYPGLFLGHIEVDDADFVDIIHTSAGVHGVPVPMGTIDFWPNKGKKKQPGCNDNFCSHWRSWRLWAESVGNPTSFPSTERGKSDIVYMGYAADIRSRGNYYLRTNANTPFGMGMEGVVK